VFKNIYFVLLRSHILYGVEVYGSAAASTLSKLVKLEIRYCEFGSVKTIDHNHVGELCKTFDTLPVSDLYELQIATFVHKLFHHS
jgi:hypothetical protein